MAKKPRRRSYGGGTVVPPSVAGGLWSVRVSVNGKRKFQGGIPSKEMATKVLAKFQADEAKDRFGLASDKDNELDLEVHAQRLLDSRELTHRAWPEDVGRWKKHLSPTLGKLKPSEVDRAVIRNFIDAKLKEGLASGTVRILVSLLSSVFERLLEENPNQVNPAKNLPKSMSRLIKSSHDPRTTPFIERKSDIELIFFELPEPLNIAYAIGALAGLRTSEAAGLKWRNVDFVGRRIHVREQAGKRKGEDTVPLKDGESRVVPILDSLLPVLQAWKEKTGGEPSGRVVPPMRVDGRKLSKESRGKYLKAALEKLKLTREGLGWYEATRHTFASQWVMGGGTIEELQVILGHYSVVMTENYSHLRVELFSPKSLQAIGVNLMAPAPEIPAKSLPNPPKKKGKQAPGAPRVPS